jgi:hypothetical protein
LDCRARPPPDAEAILPQLVARAQENIRKITFKRAVILSGAKDLLFFFLW